MLQGSRSWPFGDIAPMGADVILADPPWLFELYSDKDAHKAPQGQYSCMSLADIKALPVAELCRGDALLFLWTTWPIISDGMDVLKAWGFRYVTGGAWHKRTVHGKSAFGTGYVMRSATEPFLIGTLGSPLTARNVRNVIETEMLDAIDAATRGHSRKPDIQYDMLERMCPRALHGVELFARQRWTGGKLSWQAWGNEADKYEAATC